MRPLHPSPGALPQHHESPDRDRQLRLLELQRAHPRQTVCPHATTPGADLPAADSAHDGTADAIGGRRGFPAKEQSPDQHPAVPIPSQVLSERANHFAAPGLRYFRSLCHTATCSSSKMSVFPYRQQFRTQLGTLLPDYELGSTVPPKYGISDCTNP
uniref:(northern house mosquito) hypothetical protein n=1 Tax=Culex pipiens TaxID=7175 RepID=A0A8D8BGC3_CULPI